MGSAYAGGGGGGLAGWRSWTCSGRSGSHTAASRRTRPRRRPPDLASACQLLTLHLDHWSVESGNHLSRDVSLLEDESEIRNGKVATVPEAMAHYTANREAALEALLTRQKGNAAHALGQPSGPGAAHAATRSEMVPQGIQNPSESRMNLR